MLCVLKEPKNDGGGEKVTCCLQLAPIKTILIVVQTNKRFLGNWQTTANLGRFVSTEKSRSDCDFFVLTTKITKKQFVLEISFWEKRFLRFCQKTINLNDIGEGWFDTERYKFKKKCCLSPKTIFACTHPDYSQYNHAEIFSFFEKIAGFFALVGRLYRQKN